MKPWKPVSTQTSALEICFAHQRRSECRLKSSKKTLGGGMRDGESFLHHLVALPLFFFGTFLQQVSCGYIQLVFVCFVVRDDEVRVWACVCVCVCTPDAIFPPLSLSLVFERSSGAGGPPLSLSLALLWLVILERGHQLAARRRQFCCPQGLCVGRLVRITLWTTLEFVCSEYYW